MRTCSSTHDGTAYKFTGVEKCMDTNLLPKWCNVVLDEAYTCTNQELSPWKGKSLSVEKDAFNYYLSLHRQVVERAFGLLVGRWGIFWRPLRFSTHVNCTICASIRLGQNQGVTQCPILTKTGIDSAVDSLIAMCFGQMMLKCAKEQELIFTPAPGGIF